MRPFCVSRYKKLQLVVVHWFTSSFIITVELTGLSFVEVGPLHLVAAVGLFVSGVNEIHGRVTVTIV